MFDAPVPVVPAPYVNYEQVARAFGLAMADRLAGYTDSARETRIMLECRRRHRERLVRDVVVDPRGVVVEVR